MCSFFRKQGWENSNLWVPEHQITTTLQQKPWRPTCHLWQILTCMTSLLNHSPTALLYSKTKLFHGIQCSCIQCSSTAIMWNKICWKNKTKKKRTAKVQMFRAVGCNQITFPAIRSVTRIKLWIYITNMVCCSRVHKFFPRRVNQTWESGRNGACHSTKTCLMVIYYMTNKHKINT